MRFPPVAQSSSRQPMPDDEFASWQVRETADGVVVAVKGMPGSRKPGLRGIQAGSLRVGVTQVAEKGRANEAILEVLAKALGIRSSRLELVAGQTSREKQVLIRDMNLAELTVLIQQS